jgi:hypothetical protein
VNTLLKYSKRQYGTEASTIADQMRVQKATNSDKMMLNAFRILKGQYWNIIKRGAQQ